MHGDICAVTRMTGADSDLVFRWRNLPQIVALSGSGQKVTKPEHDRWFSEAVSDSNRLLLKITSAEGAIGLVRFDLGEDEVKSAVVSIYLLPEHSGRGLGQKAFSNGVALLKSDWPDTRCIIAEVVHDNAPAVKFFKSLGFNQMGEVRGSKTRPLIRFYLDVS